MTGLPQVPITTQEIIAPVPNLQVDTIITAQELKDNFLFGIPLTSPLTGQTLSDDAIQFHLDAATAWLERYLQVDIKQKYYSQERHDYVRSEYFNWGYIKLNHYPILKILQFLVIYPNTGQSTAFPLQWIQTDAEGLTGVIQVVPGVGSASSFIIGQGSTLLPLLFNSNEYLPDLFKVSYLAGFPNGKTPDNIIQVIGKKASIDIMTQLSNAILVNGLTHQSISIDGVSQSTSKIPFIFEKQIMLYRKQIEEEVSQLRSFYCSPRMTVA